MTVFAHANKLFPTTARQESHHDRSQKVLFRATLLMFAIMPVNYACDSPGGSSGSGEAESGDAATGPGVQLTLTEGFPIDFDDMLGGVDESAIIDLGDLREEPANVEALPRLACGSIDPAASFVEIEALQVDAGTVLDYQVAVAPRGGQYTHLAAFEGSVMAGDKVSLADSRFTIDPAGLQIVSHVVLGDEPAISLKVSASVLGDVSDLQVALSISIRFSSLPWGCR